MKKISSPVLEISNLYKTEKHKVIEKFNLILQSGESMALLYKNDENIELLCDILKGQKRVDKGKIFFKSADVTDSKNIFGVIEKKPEIPKTRSVIDIGCSPIVKRGLSKSMASVLVKKELGAFLLNEQGDKTAYLLPKNLKLRTEVFGAYMCSHELMAIDEPYLDLSPDQRETELELLEKVKRSVGLSLLVFTKDIDTAVRLADSVMIINDKTQSVGIISVDEKKIQKTKDKINELYQSV